MNSPRSRVSTTRRFRTGFVVRVVAGGVAAGAVLSLAATTGPASAAPEKVHKSYVCKYVDKPGEAERLQTGQNPIWVDNHALFRSPEAYNAADGLSYVGQQFNDGQIKSVVIVANTEKLSPEPTIDSCPAPAPPTSPTSTTTTSTRPTTTSTTTSPTSTTTTTSATSTTQPTTSTTQPTTPAALVPPSTPHSSTTTWATVTPAPTTMTTSTTTYLLQPVNAGVDKDGTTREVIVTPLRAALLLLMLFALWVAFGGRIPHVKRVGSSKDDS